MMGIAFVVTGLRFGFAVVNFGTPWFTRGSRNRMGSSLAGTIEMTQVRAIVLELKRRKKHTSVWCYIGFAGGTSCACWGYC